MTSMSAINYAANSCPPVFLADLPAFGRLARQLITRLSFGGLARRLCGGVAGSLVVHFSEN